MTRQKIIISVNLSAIIESKMHIFAEVCCCVWEKKQVEMMKIRNYKRTAHRSHDVTFHVKSISSGITEKKKWRIEQAAGTSLSLYHRPNV